MAQPPGRFLGDSPSEWPTFNHRQPHDASPELGPQALEGHRFLTVANPAGPVYGAYPRNHWGTMPPLEPIAVGRHASRADGGQSYDCTYSPSVNYSNHPALFTTLSPSGDAALILPQRPYMGHGGFTHTHDAARLPTVPVHVPAHHALQPEELVGWLSEPLSPAFGTLNTGTRRGKKFTIRFVFRGHDEWFNAHPPQMNEYAAGYQGSEAVKVAWDRSGMPPKTSGAVPLMRAALVERVAAELRVFMDGLKNRGIPLRFHGREVEFDHLEIIELSRPTDATVQPTLGILRQYRDLYLTNTGAA